MTPATLLLATALLSAPPAPDGPLAPIAARRFHVVPDAPTVLEWKRTGEADGDALDYIVRDYRGTEEARAKAVATPEGVRVERAFPQGYHEVEFPALSQRFGVVALPHARGTPDPFFAIDAAMSWLVDDDATRDELIALAQGFGLAMIRERMTWEAIQPEPGRWDWESGARFERLRESYRRAGIPVLEMGHDAPEWAGRVGKYSRDLVATADAWKTIARRWDRTWGGIEIWNEPEISFGGDMPGDQYSAYAKAVSFGLRQAPVRVPIVGGVMAHHAPEFLRACAQGGLLERVDAFSFHDYGPAESFEDVNVRFREWLRASGHGDMPLWITECGWPWKRGPERPPIDQDRASAAQIVMKAVEARACGVERFFTFVYPFYEENANNFSVMDRSATPLRSMAAYAQAIHALGGLSYLGDLKCDAPRILRSRVFGDARRAVVVIASTLSETDLGEPIRLAVTPDHVEAADGRAVPVRDGGFPLTDGLAYAWFERAALAPMIDAETRAMSLHPARDAEPVRGEPSPIVLRHRFDPMVATPSSTGYRLKAGVTSLPVRVEVVNLGETAESLDLTLGVERPDVGTVAEPRRVEVGPRSQAEVEWTVDLSDAFADFAPARVLVTARNERGIRDRLSLAVFGEAKLEVALARVSRSVRLPIEDLSRWSPNIAAGGRMTMRAVETDGWRLDVAHEPGTDRWAYPYFRLPDSVDLAEAKGLILRARRRGAGDVRAFLWEGETGVGYINVASLFPADGDWHVVRLDFDAMERSNANAPDPDGKLDRKAVRKISLGLNGDVDANELELEVDAVHIVW
ncbi:cellulase family glycosylhydrolase [Planctomyces sp. SH-PL62]|uniref:cellulase family glycosylhydrolase n=1 Tax=Planctomyces sp. SH-PL62 TaxID=1636152 RepID=UPI00078D6713|nr:cellulase family glycosylhydrolase [Planctomyces sp. SH-PL62]AMV38731.1 Cellulase (glycosyl hydrolase family 5) [Planctomyces sp. SH-PL62]